MHLHDKNDKVGVLLLAAGLSSRMGEFKPLLPLRGKTLIENAADGALEGGAEELTVVVGFQGERIVPILRRRYGSRVTIAWNRAYASTDMLESIRIGLEAMPACGSFFLLPGDMPVISPRTYLRLLSAWAESRPDVVFPTLEGRRRHPPLIGSRLIPEIIAYQGGDGLRGFWRSRDLSIRTVPVDDRGVVIDLDTQSDYKACKSSYEEVMQWKKSASL